MPAMLRIADADAAAGWSDTKVAPEAGSKERSAEAKSERQSSRQHRLSVYGSDWPRTRNPNDRGR